MANTKPPTAAQLRYLKHVQGGTIRLLDITTWRPNGRVSMRSIIRDTKVDNGQIVLVGPNLNFQTALRCEDRGWTEVVEDGSGLIVLTQAGRGELELVK